MVRLHSHAATAVVGQSYQICGAQSAQYLTSPYTYHALVSGTQDYTVAQYEALPGYGTTLPSLPSYISSQPSSTHAATIVAPNASGFSLPGYGIDATPVLFFIEGGSYGGLGMPSVSGDLFIGGSTTGSPEPQFNDGASGGGGIFNTTAHFGFEGGHDTGSGTVGSKTVTVSAGGEQVNSYLTFADGTNYHVSGVSGTTITLATSLSKSESAATLWYNNFNSGNGGLNQLAEVSAAAAQGATQVSLNQVSQPIVPGESLVLGDDTNVRNYVVQSVSGTEATGYTATLDQPLPFALGAGTPAWYYDLSGGVSVQYLNISNDDHSTGGTLTAGPFWDIEHNNIHDGYAGGANYKTTSASGIAIDAQSDATIQYNCFQRMGEYALNGGGKNSKFNYNQVDSTPYQPDLSGNGQSGCGKWWGSFNNDVIGNAFTNEGYSVCIWFDNGNAGMLVQGNYFYNIDARAIQNETGWNSDYDGNYFEDVASGIYQNDSGGWNIPGSRYNNQIIMQNNTFHNVKEGINIWGASSRSCISSGEAMPNGESSNYCSGGFPQIPNDQQYFTHNTDSVVGALGSVAQAATCSVASPCSTVTLTTGVAPGEWIGFNGQAPNAGAQSPAATTNSGTTAVSTFTGSGTMTVASTAGFPSSGQLFIETTTGQPYGATGAVLSYSGTTATSFTGINRVSGSGNLVSGGKIIAVQPYHVTAINCPGSNCTNNATATVSPAITTNVAAGTDVYGTGTCNYYATATATATSPSAPNAIPYIDGCMWENRNISVTNNTFYVNAAEFSAVALPEGETGNWSCTTGAGGDCGQNTMGYQYPGPNPYGNVSFANAMMSASTLPAPYNNLNAAGSPLLGGAGGSYGSVAANSETPYNDLWSNNTYGGDWRFQAYMNASACPVSWTGSALSWVSGTGGNACSNLTLAQWQQYWKQDAGSTSTASPTPTTSATATPTPTPTPTPTSSPAGKVGDLNNDGAVNIFDLSILLSGWGTANATDDLNHDNTVNIFDLSILLSHWGT